MKPLECGSCGADLELDENSAVLKCVYCGQIWDNSQSQGDVKSQHNRNKDQKFQDALELEDRLAGRAFNKDSKSGQRNKSDANERLGRVILIGMLILMVFTMIFVSQPY